MPQLDIFSYFSATTILVILFLSLIFLLHTYFLPKIATCLKFRKKIILKQNNTAKTVANKANMIEEPFLDMVHIFTQEVEKTVKKLTVK